MKIIFRMIILLCLTKTALGAGGNSSISNFDDKKDTSEVDKLNKEGFANRTTDPEQTLLYAQKALQLATQLNYTNGIAEAYRIRGIGLFYENQSDSAISNYLTALRHFNEARNQQGVAIVHNNIGSVYRDIKNYLKAIEYYQGSLQIASRLDMKDLVAGLYLNLGITYQKKGDMSRSLRYYEKSHDLFNKLDNPIGKASCLQSISSIYKDLRNWEKAEKYAIDAIDIAKENSLNVIVARTNLTLCVVYISTDRFKEAENAISEGMAYNLLAKDEKVEHDFLYRQYQLYTRQKSYEKALNFLVKVYQSDSTHNEVYESDKIRVLNELNKASEKEKENIILKERETTNQILFWASILVSGLLIAVIAMLVKNVSKKAQTNRKLTELNQEISLQKENVDRVNHNLEEIIDERTIDLKIKNKKLSEYSSHLSHQIRGPVATLKGLVNLNKEGLIDSDEVIMQMEKCVNDIDDKILRINDMLHDPQQNGFGSPAKRDPGPSKDTPA